MEKELDLIASGKKKKLDFLNEFYNTLENTIKTSPEVASAANIAGEEKVCPNCGAPMVIRRSRYGKLFYGCSKYPKCNGILNIK
jgi:DNA topoisomerase-1